MRMAAVSNSLTGTAGLGGAVEAGVALVARQAELASGGFLLDLTDRALILPDGVGAERQETDEAKASPDPPCSSPASPRP
jgi:hypothetical protein